MPLSSLLCIVLFHFVTSQSNISDSATTTTVAVIAADTSVSAADTTTSITIAPHKISFNDTLKNIILPLADVFLTNLLVATPTPTYQYSQGYPVPWNNQLYGRTKPIAAQLSSLHGPHTSQRQTYQQNLIANPGEYFRKHNPYKTPMQPSMERPFWANNKLESDRNYMDLITNWDSLVQPKAVNNNVEQFNREIMKVDRKSEWKQLEPEAKKTTKGDLSKYYIHKQASSKDTRTIAIKEVPNKYAEPSSALRAKQSNNNSKNARKIWRTFHSGEGQEYPDYPESKSQNLEEYSTKVAQNIDTIAKYRSKARSFGLIQTHMQGNWQKAPANVQQPPQSWKTYQNWQNFDSKSDPYNNVIQPPSSRPITSNLGQREPVLEAAKFEYTNDQRPKPVNKDLISKKPQPPSPKHGLAWDLNKWAIKHSTGKPQKYVTSEERYDYPDWYTTGKPQKSANLQKITNKLLDSTKHMQKSLTAVRSSETYPKEVQERDTIVLKKPISFEEAKFIWSQFDRDVKEDMIRWLYKEFINGNLGIL